MLKSNHREIAISNVIITGKINDLFTYYSAITTVEETGLNFQLACLKDNAWLTKIQAGTGKKAIPAGWKKVQAIAAQKLLEAKGVWRDGLTKVQITALIVSNYSAADKANDTFLTYCNTVLFNRLSVWLSERKTAAIEDTANEGTSGNDGGSESSNEATPTEEVNTAEDTIKKMVELLATITKKMTKDEMMEAIEATIKLSE